MKVQPSSSVTLRVLVFDDIPALSEKLGAASPDIEWYSLQPKLYSRAKSVDEFFLEATTEKVWQSCSPSHPGTQSLHKLVEDQNPFLYLINVNLKSSPIAWRQDLAGIEILKHLRMTPELGLGAKAHAVLYSFEDAFALLRRRPGNLILLSEGHSFLRLPEAIVELSHPDRLRTLSTRPANPDEHDFARFVRCDYDPPDAAHTYSNWWGVHQAARIANVEAGREIVDMNALHSVKESLKTLENKKARLIFASEPYRRTVDMPSKAPLPNGEFRVVCIDDEPDWAECLRAVLSGLNAGIHVNAPQLPRLRPVDADWIRREVLEQERPGGGPDLVISDLRLRGTAEAGCRPEDTSGAQLIRTLRSLSPGLPIILMTASNKAWTFEAAMRLGVDAYWMKEGIGEHAPPGGSITSYRTLLQLIAAALGEEYQFLRRYSHAVDSIKSEQSPWWTKHRWCNGETTSADRKAVHDILDGTVILLREYLRMFRMRYGFAGENDAIQNSWTSALVMECAKISELAHELSSSGRSLAAIQFDRQDTWGEDGRELRNRAVHANGGTAKIDFVSVNRALSATTAWLMVSPNARLEKHVRNSHQFSKVWYGPAKGAAQHR